MPKPSEPTCKHWRVICERDGVAQWEEFFHHRHQAIDRDGEPPAPTQDGDQFHIKSPTLGAWSPRRRRLPIAGESSYDLAIKDALMSEDFGDFLFDKRPYGEILGVLSGRSRSDALTGLFWTIDQETDPYSITLQDLLDLQRNHVHHEEDCDDEECVTCGDVECPEDADGFRDQECTACDLMRRHGDYIAQRTEAYLRSFLRSRGLRFGEHRCELEFEPLTPTDDAGVYFVLGAGDCVKIGLGRSIRKRIAELQTSHSVKLTLLAVEVTPHTREAEASYHKRFAALRTYGEWFRCTGELREFVLSLNVAQRGRGRAA